MERNIGTSGFLLMEMLITLGLIMVLVSAVALWRVSAIGQHRRVMQYYQDRETALNAVALGEGSIVATTHNMVHKRVSVNNIVIEYLE